MRTFEVDPEFASRELPELDRLCFMAREILGGYMETYDDLYEHSDDPESGKLSLSGVDDEFIMHETCPVPLNRHSKAYLSNVPYIYDANGNWEPLSEPGYVALRSVPRVDVKPPKSKAAPDEEQIVFRVPMPVGQDGAIYEGWAMDVSSEITALNTKKLGRIRKVLHAVRYGLQQQMTVHMEQYEALYFSNVPRPSTGYQIEAMLRDL
jgi:hypothetical protein